MESQSTISGLNPSETLKINDVSQHFKIFFWHLQPAIEKPILLMCYFYQQAGIATDSAFSLSVAQYAIGAIGTIGSWFIMATVGRRFIYIYGLTLLCALLFIIGSCGIVSTTNIGAQRAIGAMLLLYTFA